MDGGKRCENANVDVNTFMRFQKCISVDGALHFLAKRRGRGLVKYLYL